jgi:hypothetical protein
VARAVATSQFGTSVPEAALNCIEDLCSQAPRRQGAGYRSKTAQLQHPAALTAPRSAASSPAYDPVTVRAK